MGNPERTSGIPLDPYRLRVVSKVSRSEVDRGIPVHTAKASSRVMEALQRTSGRLNNIAAGADVRSTGVGRRATGAASHGRYILRSIEEIIGI